MESSDLKKAGLKVTLPRMKILDLMESSSVRHQSAEDIYQSLRDEGEEVGLATVYRVLTQFEAAGLVTRHHFEGGQAVFELNREGHHDHIVCVGCGKVEEFVDELIESQQAKIAEDKGYVITDHSLILYGKCPECQKKTSS
jgi:Fur family ferric uptake transcriptional regulator